MLQALLIRLDLSTEQDLIEGLLMVDSMQTNQVVTHLSLPTMSEKEQPGTDSDLLLFLQATAKRLKGLTKMQGLQTCEKKVYELALYVVFHFLLKAVSSAIAVPDFLLKITVFPLSKDIFN